MRPVTDRHRDGGWRLAAAAALAGVSTALAGCTEDAIVAVDPDPPGVTVPTVEVSALASELDGWRDTTYLGYELPGNWPFKIVADREDLESRTLGRFDIPDSVLTGTGVLAIETFVDAEFLLTFVFDRDPDSVSVSDYQLRVYTLQESYDSLAATWSERRTNVPWSTPGAPLGRLLAAGDFTAATDTIVLSLAVPADSVLSAWQITDGEPGVALVVAGGGTDFFLQNFEIDADVTVIGRADTVPATFSARATTFIYDPPQPAVGEGLRVAGLPSARIYVDFPLPDSMGGIALSEATINHAEVRFRPLASPGTPFTLEREIAITAVQVLADPFELGPKVPVGTPVLNPLTNSAQFVPIAPERLSEGEELRFNVTRLVEAAATLDTIRQVRLALRPAPSDGQAFGFWEFGSVESAVTLQPILVMLITPPIGFPVP